MDFHRLNVYLGTKSTDHNVQTKILGDGATVVLYLHKFASEGKTHRNVYRPSKRSVTSE